MGPTRGREGGRGRVRGLRGVGEERRGAGKKASQDFGFVGDGLLGRVVSTDGDGETIEKTPEDWGLREGFRKPGTG